MVLRLKFFWDHFEEMAGALFMGLMAFLSFMNVVTRYLLNYSTAWTEELVTYTLVWATLIGAALAYRQGSNLMVAFLYNKTHGSVRKVLYFLSTAASIIFFVILGYYGFRQVAEEMSYNTLMESEPIPMWYFSSAIPFCSVIIIVRIIQKARRDWIDNTIEGSDDSGTDLHAS